MNSSQAKQLNLIDFVSRICTLKSCNKNNQALFFNDLRGDKNPSLLVGHNNKRNLWGWTDYATGDKGNIIDFVMIFYGLKTVNEALNKIAEIMNFQTNKNQNISFKYVDKEHNKNIDIKTIKELNNKALVDYLIQRKINIEIARKYIKEIYYTIENDEGIKKFFGICFENDKGGYEIRNKYSKSNILNKDITHIKLSGEASKNVIIFEGFINFLSALTYYNITRAKYDVIILNSVSLVDRACDCIIKNKYENIFDYLDNDFAGQICQNKIKEKTTLAFEEKKINFLPKICNSFTIYRGFNDFNDFLKSQNN